MAKKTSFDNLLHEHNPDIITISETWLKPEVLSSEFLSTDYNIFRRDRPDGYGGVLIAYRNSLNCHHLNINFDTEAIACQLTLANHPCLMHMYSHFVKITCLCCGASHLLSAPTINYPSRRTSGQNAIGTTDS